MHRIFIMISVAFILLAGASAFAQLDSRPFSFRHTGAGGFGGMSSGGREAIMNEKLFGARPSVLFRDTGGSLLTVTKGVGSIALVQDPVTGQFRTAYHGISFKRNDPMWEAGVFNPFFVPSYYQQGGGTAPPDTITGNAIDSWTSEVYMLDKKR